MSSQDKLNQRSDRFSLVLNDNELHLLKNSQHIVNKIMCDEKQIIFIAVIYHDRDKREDDKSSLKTPHYHMVIQFGGNYRIGTIIAWLSNLFKINENQIQIEKCSSLEMQCRYLTHLDDFDKEQYLEKDIVTGYGMRETLKRYYRLTIVKDLNELVELVKQYHYDLETIMVTIAHYDKWRKYISDLIMEYHRRFR